MRVDLDARLRPDRSAAAGLGALIAVAAAAKGLGELLPSLGAPAIALLLGMVLRRWYVPRPGASRLLSAASRYVLQAAVVVLGATFGLAQVAHVGRTSVVPMLGTLAAALVAAALLGRALDVRGNLRTLVGVGTAICGASAIGAVSGVIAATESEVAYAISTIFVFNVVAVLVFPALGHLLSLSQHGFGIWAGTAINDTSSVVAAAYTYGHHAGDVAVVTKLARTTMIVPIVVVLAARHARSALPKRRSIVRVVPLFLLWFLVASALNTAGAIGPSLASHLATTATLLITVALAAIGLSTGFADIRRTGPRPLLLGAALWLVVAVTGLLLQGTL